MTRMHLLILLAVAIVLALFALRLNEKAELPPSATTRPVPGEGTSAVPPSESRPAGSIGREDPAVGTTSLPRGPGSLERP